MTRTCFLVPLALVAVGTAAAHDTWVQTNTAVVRTGDAVHVDLMLGNHGNDHRDFKLASKLAPDAVGTLTVTGPDGKVTDLAPALADLGYAPKEGYYSAKFAPAKPGLYVAAQTADRVVQHGKPVRSVRSAKAYFLASDSLDKVAGNQPGFDRPLGHPLELVPEANPVSPMGPGVAIQVKLLFCGKPLVGARVSFVPRGAALKEGVDPDHDRTTDKDGRAAFTPKAGNYYLVVAHHPTPDAGAGYESTLYAATLTVLVPETCPCCGD